MATFGIYKSPLIYRRQLLAMTIGAGETAKVRAVAKPHARDKE